MPVLSLKLVETSSETPLIRRLVFASATGGALPGFEAGAHITLQAPGVGRRKYSLVNVDPTPGATAAPSAYMLGVRLEEAGGGGSRWVHGLKPGDIVSAEPPENDFALTAGPGPVLLLAGGIGVTPLISMAAAMKGAGRPFRFLYAARGAGDFAFLDDIRALAGPALTLHSDAEAGAFLDIGAVIESVGAEEPLYACGPKPMLKAAIQETRRRGWAANRLRYELFYSAGAEAPPTPQPPKDASFEVEIKSTGQVFRVPPEKTILEVLLDAGLDPLHDCQRGECGVCQVGVLSGVPDHKDSILSESERAAGKVMQICISRSTSARLVLDL